MIANFVPPVVIKGLVGVQKRCFPINSWPRCRRPYGARYVFAKGALEGFRKNEAARRCQKPGREIFTSIPAVWSFLPRLTIAVAAIAVRMGVGTAHILLIVNGTANFEADLVFENPFSV